MKKENYTLLTLVNRSKRSLMLLSVAVLLLSGIQQIEAVPSYARQTGLSCSACHYMFPLLNQFGREFKLNGYTMTGIKTIESTDSTKRGLNNMLRILSISPLSAMVQASFTHTNKTVPGTQNDVSELPQQFSFFYSGQITPHIGSFIQLTYSTADGSIGMDNIELRFANHATVCKKDMIYGFTLNNNPTVQDVWNSVPAWRFPYSTSDVAPSPAAAPLMDGAFAQNVVGAGAYALYNHLVYGEISFYRSLFAGGSIPLIGVDSGVIKNVAPYWRLALQHQFGDHYLELGTSGMTTTMYQKDINGGTDKFTDIGIDLQYEYQMPRSAFILHPIWEHEIQNLDASFSKGYSQNKSNTLNSFKIDGEIYFNKGYAFTLGYFNISGSQDAKLYSSNLSQTPNSDGYIAEVAYMPWYNTKFSLQYVAYDKFNGQSKNFDGFGRKASDNNAIYLMAWVCF